MRFRALDAAQCRRVNVALACGLWSGAVLASALLAGFVNDFGHVPGLTYRLVSRGGSCILAMAAVGAMFFAGVFIKPGKEERP